MKYIQTQNLKSGMILASTIYDNKGNVLLKCNTLLKNNYINKIRNLGYDGIYVYEDNGIKDKMSIISEETRIKTINNLKKYNIDECLFMANEIVEEIQSQKDIVVEMINLSSYDNYTYVHSVNVDVLSVIIGIGLGLKNEELKNLSTAALLHDIGKSCIDSDIINKPEKLTPEEYEEVKKHSFYGYNMMKSNPCISATVKNAIYSHHENEDGSGYPRGLKGDNIHLFAKIIHIADVYDALTAKRVYKEAMNPAEAIEYLMANAGKQFDLDIVNVFLKYVAPYPVGVTVMLSNGEKAIVVQNNKKMLSRPIVMTRDGKLIDLLIAKNITIKKLYNK